MSIEMKISFKLPCKLIPEDKVYTALCPVLDVASQGGTAQEAKNNLTEALVLFIETCFESGTLCEVLKECGFEKTSSDFPTKADCGSPDLDYLDVPISLLAASAVNTWQGLR